MENTRRKKRSNSLSSNLNEDLLSPNQNSNDSNGQILPKSKNVQKKKMITLKQIQNIDLTTYDLLFFGRKIYNTTTEDFNSFLQLLRTIKSEFNPKLLKNNNNIEEIKTEGKFSLNNSGITNLVLFNEQNLKDVEISINSRYIKSFDLENKFINFYATKSFFKGKHCFELEIMNMIKPNLAYGLIDLSYIDQFKKDFNKNSLFNIEEFEGASERNISDKMLVQIFKLPYHIIFEKNKKCYNHFIRYGDVLGLCYDLDRKIIYLFINGEIRGKHSINIEKECSFVPIISIGSFTEIIFNPGENLKYEKNYQDFDFGFIPLDEKGKNNYEKSKLKNVTDEYMTILINNGKSIINNKNITYSDINQIYYIIYNFLGKNSFNHSYIIQKSCIKRFLESNIELTDEEMEKYYIFLKYILNASNNIRGVLKKLFFNLAENIHIFMIKGKIKYISNINKLIKLFFFVFRKEEILNIFSKIKKTTTKLFKSIFISFHMSDTSLNINSLDFLVNNNNILNNHQNNNLNTISNDNNNNNNHTFIPNILLIEQNLQNEIFQSQINLNNSSNIILNFFKEIIIMLFNDGIDNQNKQIFTIFKKFIEKQINTMMKYTYYEMKYKFNDIFKNIFLPAMDLFNQEYNKNNKCISIKKYMIKNSIEEKIGGTVNHIYENFAKEIPNFEELLNESINNYNNVFFIEFIYFFFLNEDSVNIWKSLKYIIRQYLDFSDNSFLNSSENRTFDQIIIYLDKYIYFKLFLFNLNDLDIFVQFLYNFSDFILNELYPQKLIYFLSEKIFINSKDILDFLNDSIVFLKKISYKLPETNSEKNKTSFFEEKNKLNKKLLELTALCWKNYLSILIKIIKDENVKKLSLKCEFVLKLKNYIFLDKYFTDDDIYAIFNFITVIRNNTLYNKCTNDFMKIFEGIISKENKYYYFGIRIGILIKNNKDFLILLLKLIYDNMNSNLSKLEERFCEYIRPKSIQNQSNNNINNSLINNGQNNNNDMDDEMSNQLSIIRRNLDDINIPENQLSIIRRNIDEIHKFNALEHSFLDTGFQFDILIYFYTISSDIKQLYEINTFEGKYLYNLLLSLYSIIFSPNNVLKILDSSNTQINDKFYKLLMDCVLLFYDTLIFNFLNQKDDNLLKEIAKQRNVFHFKDILKFYEKYNPFKNNNTEDPYLNFKSFIEMLEKIVPEEETININENEKEIILNGKKIDKNICPICKDSTTDTHIMPCEHSICRNCLVHCLSENLVCPFCRIQIEGIKEDPNFKI